jgi:transketolase
MKNKLIRRYFQLAKEYNRIHLGSGFTCLPIIYDIYHKSMKPNDIFILSCGHASLAWYVVLEDMYKKHTAEDYLKKSPIHPDRDGFNIFSSSGSLGHGLGIGIGAALGNKDKTIHCLVSDGECSEGSIFESLRIIYELKIPNIVVHINFNGYSGYEELDSGYYEKLLFSALPIPHQLFIHYTNFNNIPFLEGIEAHYYRMTDEDVRYINERYT